MNTESFADPEPVDQPPQEFLDEETPARLRRSNELLLKLAIEEPETTGWENLDKLSPDENVVIVVSHVSGGPDLDVPTALGVLGRHINVVLTNQSTHHSLKEEPGMWPSIKAAGGEANFKPVGYHRDRDDGHKVPDMFNPGETQAMVEAMAQGRRVMVSASSPYPHEKATEAEKVEAAEPGALAPYLAAITGAKILPVGVWVGEPDGNKRFGLPAKRPAKVTIGEPFSLDESAGELAEIGAIMARRASNELEPTDPATLIKLTHELRMQSQIVFDRVMEIRPTPSQVDPSSTPAGDSAGDHAGDHETAAQDAAIAVARQKLGDVDAA